MKHPYNSEHSHALFQVITRWNLNELTISVQLFPDPPSEKIIASLDTATFLKVLPQHH